MSTAEMTVVGTRPIRHDGADKVTGRALYGADVQMAGLLHGAVLRSPHAHARILRIDTSKAEALEGVLAVVTGADFPDSPERLVDLGEGDTPLSYIRGNVLARGKTLYKGHAVAAVAATSAHVAEDALDLIEVDYEVLPCVLTAPEAMREDAPILHEDLVTKEFGEKTGRVSNVAEHFRYSMGDLEKGFAEADVIVEREFHTATVHQGYIEPQNATALWNNDGRVLIWCSTQGAFTVRDTVACMLDLPVSQVRVTPMEIGGGFGGKIPVYLEPVAALLSRKSGRPVKLVMSRREVFEGTGPTPGSYIKVKMGARRDGRITAAQGYLAYEAGAYPGAMVGPGAMCIFAAYDLANVVIDGFDVVVNKPSTAAYRAPGATNAAFAAESVVDELAEKLGLDPLELRLRNAAKEGTRRADGPKYRRIGCVEVIQAMRNHPHYKAPLPGPNRGRGVAIGFWFNVGLPSSCSLSVNADGTVNLVEGSTDIGGTRTSVAMQAAEVLGIPAESVRPTVVDTDSVGYTAVTGGSRVTFATGWAAYEAAQDVLRQMKERAAKLWETDAAAVEVSRGVFRAGERSMTFQELAARLGETGGPVVGRGAVNPRGVGGSFSGAIADVEVDPETGKVTVLRFTSVQDVGRAIHPAYVEGQMQGGSVQGIGWALNEEYYMSADGAMLNSSLLDYRMPTSLDLPMIDTAIVEVPNPGHPFGVRGVGEANIVPPPAALANAIYRAAGVRMDRLPMNPPAIMEAIWKQRD
ncbi:MAG TPA: xanthine dehydrogenase family protein molybdopterin-binding subunit [Bryobacteraceae bacterium]|nr:xanthine dehydrogenase family protein molybdopterin-binding subunit [Bryobacteraceae bacterium]